MTPFIVPSAQISELLGVDRRALDRALEHRRVANDGWHAAGAFARRHC